MPDKYILATLEEGGQLYILEDTDIWGLETALQHGLQDGHFAENKEWALAMADRLSKLRKTPEAPDQVAKVKQVTSRENRSRGAMNRTYKRPPGGDR